MILFLFPISNRTVHSAAGKPIALLPIAKTSFLNADVCSVTFGLKKLPLTNFVLLKMEKLEGRMFPGREKETQRKNAH